MTIRYYQVEQGTPEWRELRRGIITASDIGQILTPTHKVASNDKSRQLVYQKAAERISGEVEENYLSYAMERGQLLEPFAVQEYAKTVNDVKPIGFVTNDCWGFTIGYSPDSLVGAHGLLEVKSPSRKKHVQYVSSAAVPPEYVAQVQTGLLVTGREWLDFVSYYPGMAMCPVHVKPDPEIQQSIVGAVTEFYAQVKDVVAAYEAAAKTGVMTECVELNEDKDIVV